MVKMKFKQGQSGNPKGRSKGSVNKNTKLVKLLEPHAEALVNKAVELALNGDSNAIRLCIDKLIPKAKDVVTITMPNSKGVSMENVIREVFDSLSGKELSITELRGLMSFTSAGLMQADKANSSLEEIQELMKRYERDY